MSFGTAGADLERSSTIRAQKERGLKDEVSIIALVDSLITEAHALRASDIHIDPTEKEVRIRMRVDGVLEDFHSLSLTVRDEIISRLKVLAGLRTDEHHTSQDGRIRHVFLSGDYVDIRISIVPTYFGETAVLRLLTNTALECTLESFGFSSADQKKIVKAVRRPSGMILSTGPTGSGKTTTLYTLLKLLNTPEVAIVTIEDPIEYAVPGVKQIQVNARTSLTFANGLRSILRQDPNVIMVGEIRDAETATIAVHTALTGHLLLSTLHTNDAATTLPRLLDMGIDAYLVASTISVAIGQRLVRRVCRSCKEEWIIGAEDEESMSRYDLARPIKKGESFFRGRGCGECRGSGYSGRLCINEVLEADEDIREAIVRKASSAELKKIAIKNGMTTILEDGIGKARKGETTLQEVLRIVHE